MHDAERLLRPVRGLQGISGQCPVADPKIVLGSHGRTTTGPKAALVQRLHNRINRIREALGLQPDGAVDGEEYVQRVILNQMMVMRVS